MVLDWLGHICVVFFFYVSQVFAEAFRQFSPCFAYIDFLAQRAGYAIDDICRDASEMVRGFDGSIGSCPSKGERRKAFCYSYNLSAFISQIRHLHIWALHNFFSGKKISAPKFECARTPMVTREFLRGCFGFTYRGLFAYSSLSHQNLNSYLHGTGQHRPHIKEAE